MKKTAPKSTVPKRKKATPKKKVANKKKAAPKKKTDSLPAALNASRKEITELSKASLYAKVYLLNQGLLNPAAKLDDSWKDVPILRDEETGFQVTIRSLEPFDEFCVAVPSYSHSKRYEERIGEKWFTPLSKSSDSPSWIRDALTGLHWHSSYLGTFQGEVRYRFSTKVQPAVENRAFESLLEDESFSSSRSSRQTAYGFYRPVFPAPDGFPLIGFESEELPKWALANNWLVKRLVVSPVEFRIQKRSWMTQTVSLLHLKEYVEWVTARNTVVDEDAGVSIHEIKLEVQMFVKMLMDSADQSFDLDENNDASSLRDLRPEDISHALNL